MIKLKEKRTLLAHKGFVNKIIKLGDSKFASCSHDKTIKLWKTGHKKPYKNIKFPTMIQTFEMVRDEYDHMYLVAALTYDGSKKGDLLSIKYSTLTQFSHVSKAHNTSIMAMKALSKHGSKFLVSHCFFGDLKIWRIGINEHNNLEEVLTVHDQPFKDKTTSESVEELLLSDRSPRN